MITKGVKQLIAEAERRSTGISIENARQRFGGWRKAGAPTAAKPEKKKA